MEGRKPTTERLEKAKQAEGAGKLGTARSKFSEHKKRSPMVDPMVRLQLEETEAELGNIRDDLAECQRVAEKLNTEIEELIFTNRIQERATWYAALISQVGPELGARWIKEKKFDNFDEKEAQQLAASPTSSQRSM